MIASPQNFQQFFKHLSIPNARIRNTLMVGGGQISYYIAKELLDLGVKVKIIERDKAKCEQLSDALPKADIIWGDGTNRNLLLEEGLLTVDSFAALTNLDEENIMLSLFVKSQCKAKLVTKINKITFDEVITQLDLGTILNPKHVATEYILTYIRAKQNSICSDVETLYRLIDNNMEALEFHINEGSPIVNIPLEQLKIKKNILICCINHQGLIITPKGNIMNLKAILRTLSHILIFEAIFLILPTIVAVIYKEETVLASLLQLLSAL